MRPGYVQFHGPQIFTDSLIVKRSGLARVTSVARSNYDLVNSACFFFKVLWVTHFHSILSDPKERAFTSKAPNTEKSVHGNQIDVSDSFIIASVAIG